MPSPLAMCPGNQCATSLPPKSNAVRNIPTLHRTENSFIISVRVNATVTLSHLLKQGTKFAEVAKGKMRAAMLLVCNDVYIPTRNCRKETRSFLWICHILPGKFNSLSRCDYHQSHVTILCIIGEQDLALR